MQNTKRLIGEMLLDAGLIERSHLDHALKNMQKSGGRIVENLIALGYLDTKTFLNFLSRQPGIASLDLLNYTIPLDVIGLIDGEFARQHEIVPLDKLGRKLTVGMACPLDDRTLGEIRDKTGLEVRPMLVSMSDIRVALDRYYPQVTSERRQLEAKDFGMTTLTKAQDPPSAAPAEVPIEAIESALNFERMLHLVRQIQSLPGLPETVRKVQECAQDDECSTQQMARIIGHDPGISAKVISLANSPAYGFRHQVDSVERATALLGIRETLNAVVASSVVDFFKDSNNFDYKSFWRRSLFCAAAAKLTAKTCKLPGDGGYFAAALLQDLGRIAMSLTVPEVYNRLDQNVTDAKLIEMEQNSFSIAHPEVGYALASHWDLPKEICEAIRYHHNTKFALKSGPVAVVVAFTSLLSDYALIEEDASMHELLVRCEPFSKQLHLDETKVTGIMEIAKIALESDLYEAL